MNISQIQGMQGSFLQGTKRQTDVESSVSFGNVLQKYIQEANGAVKDFETKSLALAKGEAINLHDVTIAAQKASIAVTLTTQVRDKAVEAYQEIMRMQI
ncbi:flagellar hook-basal body complex protein FliE [Neobacillus mesonae]|uniref:flagellar hook-basal body complex protein FliE n=1 Tax=Neobacillus mesonae TaxID=1193713 RepID=UPI002E1D8E05|nr:flagellar hook-basal body complex protein FliE [Neobacillus mesonae]MED4203783.1 flagellar hook-basal body complex protein FliE [Neobacillus mesonae]